LADIGKKDTSSVAKEAGGVKALGPDTEKQLEEDSKKLENILNILGESARNLTVKGITMNRKLTITITGEDGAGKTTLAMKLSKYLAKKGNIVISLQRNDVRWKDLDPFEIEILEKRR
jgi:signal recognition particle GTPase